MHDPSFLAFEIPAPWIRSKKWSHRPNAPRWGVVVRRRTNAENLGERVFPWYKPGGYEVFVAGRTLGLATLFEVWHDEPGGGDMRSVCKVIHPRGLRWIVRHRKHLRWRLMPYLHAKRRFDRCAICHRRMWKATRFGVGGWDSHQVSHEECTNLRRVQAQRLDLLKKLAGVADWTEDWRATRQVDQWLGMSEIESTQ